MAPKSFNGHFTVFLTFFKEDIDFTFTFSFFGDVSELAVI